MTRLVDTVFGPPGTGKTERLVRRAIDAIRGGTPPEAVAFTSYTRAAVAEARDRAERELKLPPDSLPMFRTIHSLCFRSLGLKRDDVFSRAHLCELGALIGEDLSREVDPSEGPLVGARGSEYLALEQFARLTRRSLEEAWHAHGGELDWYRLRRVVDAYAAFRDDRVLVDFTDMLAMAADAPPLSGVSFAVIDEAQDLSTLQWSAAHRLFAETDAVVVGADHLQSVHRWAGADPDILKRVSEFSGYENGTATRLTDNYRLPRAVAALAADIASRVTAEPYRFKLVSKVEGSVERIVSLEEADLSTGTWLLLARAGYQLAELAAHARASGVVYAVKGTPSIEPAHAVAIRAYETLRAGRSVDGSHVKTMVEVGYGKHHSSVGEDESYTWEMVRQTAECSRDVLWHDALTEIPTDTREYLLACLRRGESLTAPPRVRIETMHGAKGQEADAVLVVTDLPPRVARGYELDPDAEHRVFFVAVTRARRDLYVLDPRSSAAYQVFT